MNLVKYRKRTELKIKEREREEKHADALQCS